MSSRLIIDGNAVYEVDEDCMRGKYRRGDWGRGGQTQGSRKRTEDKEGNGSRRWGCCSKEM